MTNDEIVQDLNDLYAEEVETALRYLHLAMTTKGLDRLVLHDTMMQGFRETIAHAQVVGEKIIQVGGVPSLSVNLKFEPEMLSGQEVIRMALAVEQAALDAYQELLAKAAGNVVLEEFARAQIAVEAAHVSRLSRLLEQ